jgi:solute carrier family 12 sodium/potassium/chloride transporter 2
MKRFSTFEGVFTPTILSILGVIMYLRLGWVVGEAGLFNALMIIVLANVITLATALSMSSIVTNIRIGVGGAHSIIAKSLGIEVGGAIGVPLYLSQAISVAFYIVGFAECWSFIFPQHPMLLVCLLVWLGVFIVSYASAKLAFRLQYIIMVAIFLSLVSIFSGGMEVSNTSGVWGRQSFSGFWPVFAIFFPAVTGILAGASMSGELTDPRSSIPKGTLTAIIVSFAIYVCLAIWMAFHIDAAALVNNRLIIIDAARWRWCVIAGIMGATLSSALSMAVGSPRTLLALGKHEIIPFSSSFARINKRGEPTSAILFTALIALTTLLLGTLDSVATLLTMIFLITYGMINISMFIEQSIGIVSFRPSFRIPKFIPFIGSFGCIGVMFLIDVRFSVVAFIGIAVIYFILIRRRLKVHSPDVRSGLLMFLAEKFAIAASRLPYHPKIWKPNLLIPVKDMDMLSKMHPLIDGIVSPVGRMLFCKVIEKGSEETYRRKEKDSLKGQIFDAVGSLKEKGLFVETSVVEAPDFYEGSATLAQTVKDMFFPPNTLLYLLDEPPEKDAQVSRLIKKLEHEGLGIVLLKYHPQTGFGERRSLICGSGKRAPISISPFWSPFN